MQTVRNFMMNPRFRNALSVVVLTVLWAAQVTPVSARPAAPRKLLPVDEAKKDASFLRFRAQLQAAIARHDVAALQKSIDPDIRHSFGADGGRQSFLARFGLAGAAPVSSQPGQPSQLWAELGRVHTRSRSIRTGTHGTSAAGSAASKACSAESSMAGCTW